MKLYSVYRNDVECPSVLFHTYDEEKAKKFIETYNSLNVVNDWNNAYILDMEISPEEIEKAANNVISQYTPYWVLKVRLYPSDKVELVTVTRHYGDDPYEYAEFDYGVGYREIELIEYEDPEFLDISSKEFLQRIKLLIAEYDEFRN